MTRADSMRQTASMVRCRSVADTATDHTSFLLPCGVISCECVRLTPVPSAVLPPHRLRPQGLKTLLGHLLLHGS
jgi:hypothetical protein